MSISNSLVELRHYLDAARKRCGFVAGPTGNNGPTKLQLHEGNLVSMRKMLNSCNKYLEQLEDLL